MYPKVLADFVGPYRESGTQTVYQYCPVCGSSKWKLYVDRATGRWFCFAGEHGGGGQVPPGALTDDVRRAVITQFDYDATSRQAWPDVELPAWKELSTLARAYLFIRGVRKAECTAYHLVEMKDEPRVIIPFFGPAHRIISWIARDYTNKLPLKYDQAPGTKPLYVLPHWTSVDTAVLVEGVMDAMAVYTAVRIPVIALCGTHLSQRAEQDLRQLVRKKIVMLLDNDAAGGKGSKRIVDTLRTCYEVESKSFMLPEGADPSSVTDDVLRELLGGET